MFDMTFKEVSIVEVLTVKLTSLQSGDDLRKFPNIERGKRLSTKYMVNNRLSKEMLTDLA